MGQAILPAAGFQPAPSREAYPYLWENGHVKTTVELPDSLYRKLKSTAAEEGRSIKEILTEAVSDRLRRGSSAERNARPWESAFGGLKALHKENIRIDRVIRAEFDKIDEDEWR